MKKLTYCLITFAVLCVLFAPLTVFAQNRLKDKTEATSFASDDWLYLDGAINGVRKFDPEKFLLKANNLSELTVPGTARTNLGGTTVGQAFFTATNPDAVRFPRVNADNTVTWRTAGELASDIGGAAVWGSITGTLSNQADLVSALALKQDADADLTDLADGSLTGSKIGTGINGDNVTSGTVADARIASTIARDTEVDAKVTDAITDAVTTIAPSQNAVFDALALKQDADADLTDLADGSLTGSKVGTGINGDNVTSGTVADARVASTITRDTEWDTIAEIETATGVNIMVSTELDTLTELNAITTDDDLVGLVASQTLTNKTYSGGTVSGVRSVTGAAIVNYTAIASGPGGAINFALPGNSQSLSANGTFTVGGSPSTDQTTMFALTNTDTAAHTITMTGMTPSSFTIPASSTVYIPLRKTATGTELLGGAVTINDLTADASPDGTADYVETWDASTGLPKKVLLNNLPSAGSATDTNAIHKTTSGEISAMTSKGTPVAADYLVIEDSAAANAKKQIVISAMETALEGVLDLQDMQGAVTDAQVPNTITVDLATTATTANAGDSATAFFSSGQIERARGGTAADTSAYGAGIFGSDGSNNTIDIDTIAEVETAIGGTNIIVSTEIDTMSEIETLAGSVNIIISTEMDTMSELEALVGSTNIIQSTEIDTITELNALTTDDDIVGKATTDTFTNKTFDASATGNVVKLKDYIQLSHPHLCDGTNATIGTTSTAIDYGHATFSNSVDKASNYVEYYIQVPEDIDTGVALRARLKVRLGGADTASQRYVLSSVSVADSAVPTSSTLANEININFAGDASGASGDVETSAWTTLTSWNSALTAGQTWRIRLARDGDTSDSSTVNSSELNLTIEYGKTQ